MICVVGHTARSQPALKELGASTSSDNTAGQHTIRVHHWAVALPAEATQVVTIITASGRSVRHNVFFTVRFTTICDSTRTFFVDLTKTGTESDVRPWVFCGYTLTLNQLPAIGISTCRLRICLSRLVVTLLWCKTRHSKQPNWSYL